MLFRWFEHSQTYHPSRTLEASPEILRRQFEDVRFKASDGVDLHGWYFPAAIDSPRAQFVFLSCHGNGGNISHRLPYCATLLATGAAVFVFDYRGYGTSGGKPTEEGTYRDAQAAHAWLVKKGFAPANIIAIGESLGGAVAAELALRETLGALILQSTFTSIPDIGAELFPWLPVRWLASIKYDTYAKLPRIQIPVLVLHSPADDLVKYPHATKNFAVALEPKFFRDLSGPHNQPVGELPAYREALEDFLRVLEQRPRKGQ